MVNNNKQQPKKESITVTVAIPAFNEGANIAALIKQVLKQSGKKFILEKVLIISDGSTDDTARVAQEIAKYNDKVNVLSFELREGKVKRLNQIYRLNKSEILVILDGDIALQNNHLLNKLIEYMSYDKEAKVVAIHQIPVRPDTFVGKAIYAGYEFWDRSRLSVRGQNHIQNLYGAATAYRKVFAKKFRFPADITDDRGYLYMKAKEVNGFRYFKGTNIYYHPVSALSDFFKLSDRSFGKNQKALEKYFGAERVANEYKIPVFYKIRSIAIVFIKSPIYTIFGIVLNILTRIIKSKDKLYDQKMWEVSKSTKKTIAY